MAVRITHKPSGVTAEYHDHRDDAHNRYVAKLLLQYKLVLANMSVGYDTVRTYDHTATFGKHVGIVTDDRTQSIWHFESFLDGDDLADLHSRYNRLLALPTTSMGAVLCIESREDGQQELFAADLYRMYARYFDKSAMPYVELELKPTGNGGLTSVIIDVHSLDGFDKLRFETGLHKCTWKSPYSDALVTSTARVKVIRLDTRHEISDDDIEMYTFKTYAQSNENE